MRSFWMFLSGLVAGIILMGVSYQYHFVFSEQGLLVVPKPRPSLSDVYADIRGWSLEDWVAHPDLARALIADGRDELVRGSVVDAALDKLFPTSSDDARDETWHEPPGGSRSASELLDTSRR
jgi:hypothetical protein